MSADVVEIARYRADRSGRRFAKVVDAWSRLPESEQGLLADYALRLLAGSKSRGPSQSS